MSDVKPAVRSGDVHGGTDDEERAEAVHGRPRWRPRERVSPSPMGHPVLTAPVVQRS